MASKVGQELVSAAAAAALTERKEHPLRRAVVGWLEAAGLSEPDGIVADVALVLVCGMGFFLVTAGLRRVVEMGKQANAEMARQKWQQTKEAERVALEKRQAQKNTKPNKGYSKTGLNAFSSIAKSNARVEERKRQADALRPRTAWLGKTQFTRTPDPTRVSLTRCRCWFGSECYRTSEAHKAAYAHPGDTDWFDRKVMVHLKPATEKDLAACARGFTKAGGRGEFVPTESAGVFLKAYSGLPAVFLKKIGETVIGMSAVIPKIRREQFVFAMQATDAMQLVLADGDVTVDDLVLEGLGGSQQSAEDAEKERIKSGVGLPPGTRAELRSLSTPELRARVAREESLLKRERALAVLGEEGGEAAHAASVDKPTVANEGKALFDRAYVDRTRTARVLVDGKMKNI